MTLANSAPMAGETRGERRLERQLARATTPRGAAIVIAAVTTSITIVAGLLQGIDLALTPGAPTCRSAGAGFGSEVRVHFTIAAAQAVSEHVRELAEDVGDDRAVGQLAAGLEPNEGSLVGRFSPRTRVREGEALEVVVDQRTLHFFDPETGLAIRGG